ncbi:hypothetical protein D9M69_424910 [compost metagenome]
MLGDELGDPQHRGHARLFGVGLELAGARVVVGVGLAVAVGPADDLPAGEERPVGFIDGLAAPGPGHDDEAGTGEQSAPGVGRLLALDEDHLRGRVRGEELGAVEEPRLRERALSPALFARLDVGLPGQRDNVLPGRPVFLPKLDSAGVAREAALGIAIGPGSDDGELARYPGQIEPCRRRLVVRRDRCLPLARLRLLRAALALLGVVVGDHCRAAGELRKTVNRFGEPEAVVGRQKVYVVALRVAAETLVLVAAIAREDRERGGLFPMERAAAFELVAALRELDDFADQVSERNGVLEGGDIEVACTHTIGAPVENFESASTKAGMTSGARQASRGAKSAACSKNERR